MLAQETLTLSMPLTAQEHSELSRCEGFIEQNLQTLFEVGKAFAQIRDAKLYRETHKTFEEYCIDRWKISRPRAYQLIDASIVQENLSTIVDKNIPLPTNESQTRALKKVAPEKQPELWSKAIKQNNGHAPTGRQIVQVIENEFEKKPHNSRKPTPKQIREAIDAECEGLTPEETLYRLYIIAFNRHGYEPYITHIQHRSNEENYGPIQSECLNRLNERTEEWNIRLFTIPANDPHSYKCDRCQKDILGGLLFHYKKTNKYVCAICCNNIQCDFCGKFFPQEQMTEHNGQIVHTDCYYKILKAEEETERLRAAHIKVGIEVPEAESQEQTPELKSCQDCYYEGTGGRKMIGWSIDEVICNEFGKRPRPGTDRWPAEYCSGFSPRRVEQQQTSGAWCSFCQQDFPIKEKLYWSNNTAICRTCAAKAQIELLHPNNPEVLAECQQLEQECLHDFQARRTRDLDKILQTGVLKILYISEHEKIIKHYTRANSTTAEVDEITWGSWKVFEKFETKKAMMDRVKELEQESDVIFDGRI